MADRHSCPTPTAIHLHQKRRVLEIEFDDGARFDLPCEYLRVYSPSAEVRAARNRGEVITGKEEVNIIEVIPAGGYAVQLVFDDGHDTGIYAWKTLYELGREREKNWQAYLHALQRAGYRRAQPITAAASVRILYFADLVDQLGQTAENVSLPPGDEDVAALLGILRTRGEPWAKALADEAVRVAVNKQLASTGTRLKDGDEVALVPAPPRRGT